MMRILRIQQFLDFTWNLKHFQTCNIWPCFKACVSLGDLDKVQWSNIIWIMVLHRNWWICDQSGFSSGSFAVLWSEWSLITDPDPDNSKEIETQKLRTAFLITFKVPLVCYLHKTGMFADTQHLLLILFSVHPRWREDFSVGLNTCLSFYKKVKLKSGLSRQGPRTPELSPQPTG